MIYQNYYYLTYKLNTSSLLWIIDESIYKDDLFDKIFDIESKEEVYYIIQKKYPKIFIDSKLSTKFKRFMKFKINNKCKIIYNT